MQGLRGRHAPFPIKFELSSSDRKRESVMGSMFGKLIQCCVYADDHDNRDRSGSRSSFHSSQTGSRSSHLSRGASSSERLTEVKSIGELKKGDKIRIQMLDGQSFVCKVSEQATGDNPIVHFCSRKDDSRLSVNKLTERMKYWVVRIDNIVQAVVRYSSIEISDSPDPSEYQTLIHELKLKPMCDIHPMFETPLLEFDRHCGEAAFEMLREYSEFYKSQIYLWTGKIRPPTDNEAPRNRSVTPAGSTTLPKSIRSMLVVQSGLTIPGCDGLPIRFVSDTEDRSELSYPIHRIYRVGALPLTPS